MKPLPSIRIAIMLLVAVALIGGGFTMWAQSSSQGSKARYLQLVKEVPNETQLNQMVAASQSKVDEYKSQLQHLEQAVPGLAYVPTLLTELENLGKKHDIEVTGVRPVIEPKIQKSSDDKKSGVTKKPPYQEMSIDITGRGSYGNVMQMVEEIKKFPKIIAIQTVALLPHRASSQDDLKDKAKSGLLLDASVRIKAYLFPMPTTKPVKEEGASS